MPTEVLSPGRPHQMVQNRVYALPVSRCFLFCPTATPGLEQSNDLAFATLQAITLDANDQAEVAGGFLRSTAVGGALVSLKKA